MRRYFTLLSPESWAMIGLCLADLVFTVWLLAHGHAEEANPIMRYYLQYGIGVFVVAKMTLVVAPLLIIEWGLRLRPHTVRRLARLGVCSYVGLYLALHAGFNAPDAIAQRFEPTNYPPIDRELLALERAGFTPPYYTDGAVVAIPEDYSRYAEMAWGTQGTGEK
ncbi:MAG: hypothetical protein KatS3mg020_0097 [Fimbriimonadales bacterium]|nr:MAG: hypothetical protein KatS3mg020_0097 [Fimbriimonadales bacterium]